MNIFVYREPVRGKIEIYHRKDTAFLCILSKKSRTGLTGEKEAAVY